MHKKKLLFVCNENLNRSPTAEDLFKGSKKVIAKSCGTNVLALKRINKHSVKWADKIFVMEQHNKEKIIEDFPEAKQKIKVLEVFDLYPHGDSELVEILKKKLKRYL